MPASSFQDSGTPRRSSLIRALSKTPPGRFVERAIRKPEYGVLYLGTMFWVVAGALGIARPLFSILVAHV